MSTNTGIVKGFPSEDQYNEDMQSVIMSLDPYDQLNELNDSTLFVLFREAGVDIRKHQALVDKLSAYLTSDGVQLRITGVRVPDDLYEEFFDSDDDEDYEFELEDEEEARDADFDFLDDPDDYPEDDEGYFDEDGFEDEAEDEDPEDEDEDPDPEDEDEDPDAQEVVEVEEEDIPDFKDDDDEDF